MTEDKQPAVAESKSEDKKDDMVAVPPKKSGGNNKTLVIVLVVVFVVLVLPGLVIGGAIWWFGRNGTDKVAENIIESATGSDVDIDSSNGSYTIKSGDGSAELSSSAKLPDNFPSDVPLYGNQTITSSYRSSSDGDSYWSVSATTSDKQSDVESDLKDQFTDWTSGGEYSVNDSTTTVYEMGDLTVTLTVAPDSSDSSLTSITYMVTEKSN